jgi:hypothetical protein
MANLTAMDVTAACALDISFLQMTSCTTISEYNGGAQTRIDDLRGTL